MNATSTVMQQAQTRAVARSEKPSAGLRGLVEKMAPAIKAALPAVMTPERFSRIAISAISNNPALASSTPQSFLGALMTAAQLGLEPNTPLGQAYLIPYRNHGTQECQFQLGYKGLIALAYRSGEVSSIQAEEVCENDDFEYALGLEPKLRHVPARKDRGNPTHYYAVWKTKSGASGFAVMSVEDIRDHAKKFSKAGAAGPWATNFSEMARKTVLKKALKYAPLASDFVRGIASDGAVRDYREGIDSLDTESKVADIEDAVPADAPPAAQEAPSGASEAQTPPTTR